MSTLLPFLARDTGLSETDLWRIIRSSPYRYKTYTIPKRDGGARLISQPAVEVKVLQRSIITEILSKLPVHSAAMAYRTGVSIRDNAAAHVKNSAIIKYDFSDFFPSIKSSDWITYCLDHSIFEYKIDIQISALILFQKSTEFAGLRLAIGAPSSPMLSNVLLYNFDSKIFDYTQSVKVNYTRYADDVTFSAPRLWYMRQIGKEVRSALREIKSPRLSINENKTVVATNKYKRFVTGLVLSDQKAISLGRARKRTIAAAVHHYKLGKLPRSKQFELAGMLAFVNSAEPEFIGRLRLKYGSALIDEIRGIPNSRRQAAPG